MTSPFERLHHPGCHHAGTPMTGFESCCQPSFFDLSKENLHLKKIIRGMELGNASLQRKLDKHRKLASRTQNTIRYWKNMYRGLRTVTERELRARYLDANMLEISFQDYVKGYFKANGLLVSKPDTLVDDQPHDLKPFPIP